MMQMNRQKYAPHVANHVSLGRSPIMFQRGKERGEIVNAGYAEQKLKLLLIVAVPSSVVISL